MIFFEKVLNEISSHVYNDHRDNWDHLRFGEKKRSSGNKLRAYVQNILNRRGYHHMTTIQYSYFQIHRGTLF